MKASRNYVDPLGDWPNTHPVFSVNFYQISGKHGRIADHWPWIYRLAQEYATAFKQILAHWPKRQVRALHHSLSWEHATAIVAAIRLVGQDGARLVHLCFLMYSPHAVTATGSNDVRRHLLFRVAFRSLASFSNVRLFASCAEYSEAYRSVLNTTRPLPIHPVFLASARPTHKITAKRANVDAVGPTRTLLYAGAVKAEKGFARLPQRLEAACAEAYTGDALIVQYFKSKTDSQLDPDVAARLHSLAAHCPAVTIHPHFWEDTTLSRQLKQADVLLLDYDAHAYRNKTSGLLWLAALYDVAVVGPDHTWLSREAMRLGVPYAFTHEGWPATSFQHRPELVDQQYREVLFQPFFEWLQAQD